ncbi:hypothetical protein FRC00_006692 [Tulasnella sp. 408]|nr:hypothetical protein FRC00_006692 [Tulasnella sp. 408]
MPTPLRPISNIVKQASAKRERRRGDEESTRAALGRTVARFMRMYGNSKLALMQALDGSQSDQEERRRNPSALADDEVLLYYLTDHCPTLGSMIDEALSMRNPVKELNKLASDIDEGWSEARNTDTASLKKGLAANFNLDLDYDEHGHWVPPLNLTKRHLWGPHHPQLFPLVVPVRKPPLNDDELEMLKQAGATVPHTLWYDWMWKDRKHNPQNLDEGFLQSDLLGKVAFLWIYFGAVINPTSSKLAAARKVGFTSVTVHSIAYTATLLRFALSCELRIDQNFNSAGFYQHLVQYLEHEDQHELTAEILKWWNRNVFPGGVAKTTASESNASETWQLAIKQRAERKAAAALRQQQQVRGATATTAAASISTPNSTPRSPLDDTTNAPTPRLSPRSSTSTHSALGLDPWADQTGNLGDSTAEPDADRPAKKTKRIPSTRVQESDNESDIDGDEVQEEMEIMGAAQRKQKPAKAGRKPRAPDARRSSRKATRKAA